MVNFFGPADTSTFKVFSNPVTGFVPSASSVNGSLGSGTYAKNSTPDLSFI